MDIITVGPDPLARYVLLTVGVQPVGFTATQLMGRDGQQVTRAVGRVLTNSVNMGVLNIINPTSSVGLPLAANDLVVIEGAVNISRVLFAQNSGAATIWFLLTCATL